MAKSKLTEEAKQFLPKIKKLYPNLDDVLIDRISKYCVIYSEGTDTQSVKKAIKRFESTFEEILSE